MRAKASAIWLRPVLCLHTNKTNGLDDGMSISIMGEQYGFCGVRIHRREPLE